MVKFLHFLDINPFTVKLHLDENVPKATTDSGLELTGCAPISRYFAEKSPKGKGVIGNTPQERAEIQQWLEFVVVNICEESNQTKEPTKLVLEELNSYLKDRTYFVGSTLTLADIFFYYSLHSHLAALTFQEKEKYLHLSRWFDLVQHHKGLRQNLSLVMFSKTPLYRTMSN